MAISGAELKSILHLSFPNAEIRVEDLAGDNDHWSLEIIDSSFKGLSLINQHRLVKNALKEALGSNLHAITIKTKVN